MWNLRAIGRKANCLLFSDSFMIYGPLLSRGDPSHAPVSRVANFFYDLENELEMKERTST